MEQNETITVAEVLKEVEHTSRVQEQTIRQATSGLEELLADLID